MARPSANYSAREKKTAKWFSAIVYSEIGDYGEYVTTPEGLALHWEQYYIICHDRDVWDSASIEEWCIEHPDEECPYSIGEPKKKHWHILAGGHSPCMLGRAARKIGVKSNLVQIVHNKRQFMRYLVHKDNPDKFQYSPDEVLTNDENFEECLKESMDISMKATKILEYIDGSSDFVTIADVSKFAIRSECWDEFRRGQHLFCALIKEHNDETKLMQYYQKLYQERVAKFIEQTPPPPYVTEAHYQDFKEFVQLALSEY